MKRTRIDYCYVPMAFLLGLICALPAMGEQIPVDMTTTISSTLYNGQEATSILQYGSANSTRDIRFIFEKLDTVSGGSFAVPHVELKEVILTFHFQTGNTTLTVTNDSLDPFTFTDGNTARIKADFTTEEGGKWIWGLHEYSLYDQQTPVPMLIADEADFNKTVVGEAFSSDLTLGPKGSETDTFSKQGSLLVEREGLVGSAGMSYYEGAGDWTFDVLNVYPITFTITGGEELSVGGASPTSSFYTSVEYVVIPEPGSAMLVLLLAGGGLAGRRVLRRRRDWKGAPPPPNAEMPVLPPAAPVKDDFQHEYFGAPYFEGE